jgi:hypothetical protein
MLGWLLSWFKKKFPITNKKTTYSFRPRLEALEARVTPTMSNHGGAILANAQVQGYYLGSNWNTNPTLKAEIGSPTTSHSFDQFLTTVASGPYLSMLGNAGYTGIGAGSGMTGVIHSVTNLPTTVTDAQIQSYLQSAISGNLAGIQQPNANTVYFVFVQDNTVVDLGSGYTSMNAFLSYHLSFSGKDANGNTVPIRYAVIPMHASAGNATQPWLSPFDSMTEAASHELAEAVTDPDGRTWFDESGEEMADVDNTVSVYLNGYAVQRLAALPGSFNNFLPITPAGATASHQVNFSLRSDGTLWAYSGSTSNPTVTRIVLPSQNAVKSISDQGIDAFGQPMIDIVDVKGNAYEYHDLLPGNSLPGSNPNYFPFTSLGSGVKQAVAGQGVSYVLTTSGSLKEYVDYNYGSYVSGYGANPSPYAGGVIATNVTAISAGTDKIGANAVDYTITSGNKSSLYEWRDVIATSTLISSANVASFSSGQQGVHAYVSSNKVYLARETPGSYTTTGFTTTVVTTDASGNVSTVALGTNNTGGYQLEVIYNNATAYTYNNTTTTSRLLATNVKAVSKPINGTLRVLSTASVGTDYDPFSNKYWSDSGDVAVA